MTTLVSRNTIKLATSASSSNNYYRGYAIVVTRLDKISGKETVQKKEIIAYDGPNRTATIDGMWDIDLIPGPETTTKKDSYKIVPLYADTRVSINPAVQAMDYITSDRYGRGLNPTRDLDLPSWLETARACDTQSDVTIEIPTGTLPGVGSIYRYPPTGNILWQGKVVSVSGRFVRFTDNIGKLTNAWNSWKEYKLTEIVYVDNRLYTVTTAGAKATKPVHTSGTVNGLVYRTGGVGLTRVSGTGATPLTTVAGVNPIRTRQGGTGPYISGYSLYDADSIDYWRYAGWDEHAQRYATRHQTNMVVDTSVPLFDNMNSLLEHFGGILRYNNGKYFLELEQGEGDIPTTDTEPRNITEDHIVGKIRISDEGIRSAYNSLTVSFADPANKFEARNISFFNSEYLKADRNVQRKGNISIPGITNYYNARLASDKFLTQSRYGLNITFNMAPRGVLLLAGRVIQVNHVRYGWVNKKFRISDMTHNTDCSVDIVAKEYDDSFHAVKQISQPPSVGLAGENIPTTLTAPYALRVTNITDSNEAFSGMQLTWENAPGSNPTFVTTEVYSSSSPHLFLDVTVITGGNTLASDGEHGLKVGNVITAKTESNGITMETPYYVVQTPSLTTFQISTQKGGTPISTLTNGTNLAIVFLTATMIANVPVPENTYFDSHIGTAENRVDRYYWIRHRITEQ